MHLKGPSGALRSRVISSNFLPFLATNTASLSATDWASLEAGEAADAPGASGQSSSWTRVSSAPGEGGVSKQRPGAEQTSSLVWGCVAMQAHTAAEEAAGSWHNLRKARCPSAPAWLAAARLRLLLLAQARHLRCQRLQTRLQALVWQP